VRMLRAAVLGARLVSSWTARHEAIAELGT
jgi:hypothetical protein